MRPWPWKSEQYRRCFVSVTGVPRLLVAVLPMYSTGCRSALCHDMRMPVRCAVYTWGRQSRGGAPLQGVCEATPLMQDDVLAHVARFLPGPASTLAGAHRAAGCSLPRCLQAPVCCIGRCWYHTGALSREPGTDILKVQGARGNSA